jgi:hypothetical protein
VVISELNTSPVVTPVNASPASLRTQAHDSEPKWCATPFLCGSFIRYSMPVYLGASLITLSAWYNTDCGIVRPSCFATCSCSCGFHGHVSRIRVTVHACLASEIFLSNTQTQFIGTASVLALKFAE